MTAGDVNADDVDLPADLGRPAVHALLGHGYRQLAQLDGVPADEIADLHGIGPRALQRLRHALEDRGFTLG